MTVELIKKQILQIPIIAGWPEMVAVLEKAASRPRLDWKLPLLACESVCGERSPALNAAAAIACVHSSIVLVDDLLDEDPRGLYRELGSGRAANLALAFQAGAFQLIDRIPVSPEKQACITKAIGCMGLDTAWGQQLDVKNLRGEENYWQVVRAKSTPYFRTALYVGALSGNASSPTSKSLQRLGELTGEVIQIYDDLMDALQSPASPDWQQARSNLAILYTSTAPHERQTEFLSLVEKLGEDPAVLPALQAILIQSGAVAYCGYQAVKRYQMAHELIGRLELTTAAPLFDLLDRFIQPLRTLLEELNVPLPDELRNKGD